MTSLSKIIVATALVASFAAPAFAATINAESSTVEERNVYTNAQTTSTRGNDGTQAYAMERRADRAPAAQMLTNSSTENLSAIK